jgi:DNA-binding transcriptional regulator GbsR (MarR family)
MTDTDVPGASDRGSLRDDELKFIEEHAALLFARGMPYSSGRVYGYLLLRQTPVSLDEIAEALAISRVGAWNAARRLETFGHVQRHGSPGSKRALYSPSDNFATPLLGQTSLLQDMAALLEQCAQQSATPTASPHLQARADFYRSVADVMMEKIKELQDTARMRQGI